MVLLRRNFFRRNQPLRRRRFEAVRDELVCDVVPAIAELYEAVRLVVVRAQVIEVEVVLAGLVDLLFRERHPAVVLLAEADDVTGRDLGLRVAKCIPEMVPRMDVVGLDGILPSSRSASIDDTLDHIFSPEGFRLTMFLHDACRDHPGCITKNKL